MTFSLRKAGFVCGAFATWGLAGCDSAEINAPQAGEKPAAAVVRAPDSASAEPKSAAAENAAPASAVEPTADAVSTAKPDSIEALPAAGDAKPAVPSNAQPPKVAATPGTPPSPADRPRLTSKVVYKPGETQEVTFDTIKLPLEKDQPFHRSLLTKEVVALDGQPIRIRGYILPSFQQSGITQFVLVRDNLQCCFGPGAALHDCIIVEMKPGTSADYTTRPVSVEGKFTLAELVNPDDGKHLAIYHLDGEKVR